MARYHAKHYNKRKSKGKIVYILLIILFLVMIVFSSMKIIKWYLNNNENKKIKNELSDMVTVNENASNDKDKYTIDFNDLKNINQDAIAWLKVNGTDIQYVIVKANNNDYYLRRNFNKQYNVAGWPFADYKNKFDGTDKNIVIYGHNMLSNAMFGTLPNILKEDWYNNEENYNILLATEQGNVMYRVFSVYQIENEDYYIQTQFNDNNAFKEFINTIKGRSIKDFNTEVTENDSILTLSTCASTNKYRIVLHAKKIVE